MDTSKYSIVTLFAGGVGITPMMSIALHLAAQAEAGGGVAAGKTKVWKLINFCFSCFYFLTCS